MSIFPKLIPQQQLMIKPWDCLLGFKKPKKEHIRDFIPKQNLYWTSSARNALFILLSKLQKQQRKQLTIALPAFTCQVVRAAAKRANSEIIYYDYDIDININKINKIIKEKPDVLLLCYNFGYLPKELTKISGLCKKNNIILVEDCAQALGAKNNNKLAGSFGDYALYSFGISKNIGFTGGILASNEKLELPKQKPEPIINLLKKIIESGIGSIILNKYFYPLFAKTLQKQVLTKTKYSKNEFTCSQFTQNMINNLAKNYSKILKQKQDNYKTLNNQGSTDACLYYSIIPTNSTEKHCLIKKAKYNGIELDNLKSFIFLPENTKENHNQFKNASTAAANHLAFALLRNSKEIQKLKKVLSI